MLPLISCNPGVLHSSTALLRCLSMCLVRIGDTAFFPLFNSHSVRSPKYDIALLGRSTCSFISENCRDLPLEDLHRQRVFFV